MGGLDGKATLAKVLKLTDAKQNIYINDQNIMTETMYILPEVRKTRFCFRRHEQGIATGVYIEIG